MPFVKAANLTNYWRRKNISEISLLKTFIVSIISKWNERSGMRKLFFFLSFLIVSIAGFGQNKSSAKKTVSKTQSLASVLNGQWRGSFGSNGDIVITGNDNTEYVLELNIEGTTVTGYSYSYFQDRAFYVICTLEGTLNPATKTITVTEIARIKGSTPQVGDCFQTHILTYKKEGDLEELTGRWKTAPGQLGDCGFGKTTLVRKTLSSNLASYNKKTTNNTPFSPTKPATKKPEVAERSKPKPPVTKTNPAPPATATVTPPPATPASPVIKEAAPVTTPAPEKQQDIPIASDFNYEKRNTNLLQTITIQNPTIRVALYDNGVVDGDSISLFYNNKLILSHQRLSETAITLTLNVNTNKQVNDLTMYAENLGEIPPNTALMVVTDGDKRYEIPVTSDLKNSGTVRFVFGGDK